MTVWMSRSAVVLMAVVCVACSPPGFPGDNQAASPTPKSSSPTSSAMPGETATAQPPEAAGNAVAVSAVPADPRLALEQHLGQHAVLMMDVMQGNIDEQPQVVAAAAGALRRNTKALGSVLESLYGSSLSTAFMQVWSEQVPALTAYSAARADDDPAAVAAATDNLTAYPARYGDAASRLTSGKLDRAAAGRPVQKHLAAMVRATDTYAARDFPAAFASERKAYAAMFTVGNDLYAPASAKRSGARGGADGSSEVQLRTGLGRLLGEHSDRASDVTRSIVSHKPGAEAAAAALNQNTKEILAALQGALGPGAAKQFGRGWAAKVDALVAFAVAVAEGNVGAQSRARAALDSSPDELGTRLSALSGANSMAQAVGATLKAHNEQMLQQVTAYAARDFATSQELAYAGYSHMFSLAHTMAGALARYAAKNAPLGGADTGGGGSAAY